MTLQLGAVKMFLFLLVWSCANAYQNLWKSGQKWQPNFLWFQ